MMILAVDPGTMKCGLAILEDNHHVCERGIVRTEEFLRTVEVWRRMYPAIGAMVVGNGTGSSNVRALLGETYDLPVRIVPERDTTMRARTRYFREFPPPWFMRWIPLSFRVPPMPVDDWAAVLIGEDYLEAAARAER
jgi:RNase H-fold protein (predicted Holliday junction resolvase)